MNNIDWELTWTMIGSIATSLAVIASFAVLFLQRFFDNKRFNKENESRLALGSFYQDFNKNKIGFYFDSEESIQENPFKKSKIEIPIVNVGKTPVSEVEIKVTFPGFYKNVEIWNKNKINEKLTFHNSTEIYAKVENAADVIYEVYHDSTNKKIIHSHTIRKYRIGPIISGEKYLLKLSSREELYLQYLLFMLNERSIRENTPNGLGVALKERKAIPEYFLGLKLEITYLDYLGKHTKKDFYLELFNEGHKEFHSFSPKEFFSTKEPVQVKTIQNWHLAPINYESIKNRI